MEPLRLTRSSDPIDAGTNIDIGNTPTPVLDADDADRAVKFILQNNTDVAITVGLDDSFAAGQGVVLLPGPAGVGGGVWEEDRYAGPVWARHHGASGTKPLTRIIF